MTGWAWGRGSAGQREFWGGVGRTAAQAGLQRGVRAGSPPERVCVCVSLCRDVPMCVCLCVPVCVHVYICVFMCTWVLCVWMCVFNQEAGYGVTLASFLPAWMWAGGCLQGQVKVAHRGARQAPPSGKRLLCAIVERAGMGTDGLQSSLYFQHSLVEWLWESHSSSRSVTGGCGAILPSPFLSTSF